MYLIDMEGKVVQTWTIGTSAHLLDNGNLLDTSRDDPSGFQGLKEVDWDGKVVWEYSEKPEGYAPHHDLVRGGGFPLPLRRSGTVQTGKSAAYPGELGCGYIRPQMVEYINPVTREGALKVMPDSLPMTNSVFRAYRYTADHPALKGTDLSPKALVTEMPPRVGPRRPERSKVQGGRDGR